MGVRGVGVARGVLLARGVDLGVTRGEALLDSKGVPRGVGWVGVKRLLNIKIWFIKT